MSLITAAPPSLRLRERTLDFSRGTHLMGILNVTPDSFSDGGTFDRAESALAHALRMEEEGAVIIDVGGESTRPGAPPVPAEEEIARVIPVIEMLRARSDVPISVDTRKADVAAAAVAAGADMLNDVTALRGDDRMRAIVAAHDLPVVLMHMQGDPATMQQRPRYRDVVAEVLAFFRERIAFCRSQGVSRVIVDPGIGFGKNLQHNLALLRALPRFRDLGCPLLVGTSRKSFIGQITGLPVGDRLAGSIASNVHAALRGAHILRVHDVAAMRAALDVIDAIEHGEENFHAV
ncbi:MAG: dihydropteroate synthase [Bacteroidota bacterium]|nr:dihydropteroate synthase [Bacteroidota bacterium]